MMCILIPDEISEPFVEISNDLTMNSDAYLKLLERMQCFRDEMISLRYECFNSEQLYVFPCIMQTNLAFI